MTKEVEVSCNKSLSLAMELGKSMIKCGAEINRVEETIIRVCRAYGMAQIDVFSIISMINVTASDSEGNTFSQMRRVYSSSTNFGKLERLNALSRKICETGLSVDEAKQMLDEINSESKKFHLTACIGHMFAAGGFAIFFGGTLLDGLAAMPIAVMIYLMNTYIKTRGMNKLFYTALCSALSGFLAFLFVKIGFGNNADMIMIGDIMLMIPGLMLINSIREMLCGDLMSGLLRMTESIVLSMSIACGFALPILIMS
ncbi:MAG: threonine/serine exporter family protein [Faecalibacterium sp.]|nr:threonine/serine exporter family protein [Ruminococcus sp.]MCM1393255.1 threonine/serine exporter family protein [Ruminococcus sp.]MCM1486715.1 threonine/serine exporter family protein [Faecalibacterium sp.]